MAEVAEAVVAEAEVAVVAACPLATWSAPGSRPSLQSAAASPTRSWSSSPREGQFTNGQFTWDEANPLTGQVTIVQGTYTVGPLPGTGTQA